MLKPLDFTAAHVHDSTLIREFHLPVGFPSHLSAPANKMCLSWWWKWSMNHLIWLRCGDLITFVPHGNMQKPFFRWVPSVPCESPSEKPSLRGDLSCRKWIDGSHLPCWETNSQECKRVFLLFEGPVDATKLVDDVWETWQTWSSTFWNLQGDSAMLLWPPQQLMGHHQQTRQWLIHSVQQTLQWGIKNK